MSDQPGMDHEELIAALRSDMAATAAERDAAVQKAAADAAAAAQRDVAVQKATAEAAAAEREAAAHAQSVEVTKRALAEAEVARLEQAAKDAAMPDAEIRAGLEAIRQKFADLF